MNLVTRINLIKLAVVVFGLAAFLTVSANKSYAQVAPTVQSITETVFASNATTHNVNIPAVNAGDLLLAIITSDGSATVTVPSGWTELYTFVSQEAPRSGAYYMFAPSNASATTVNFITSSSETMAAQVYRITDASLVTAGTPVSGTTTQPNPPSLSPGWGSVSTLWIALANQDNAGNTVNSYPANYTNGTRTAAGSTTTGAMVASARRTATLSSEDPGVFTMSGSSGAMAQTIAITAAAPRVMSITETTFASNGTVHNVNIPAVDTGDLLVSLITYDGTGTITTPSGWTLLGPAAGGSSFRTVSYYMLAPSNASATTVNFQTSASETMAAQVYRIKGASAVEASQSPVTATTNTPNPPSYTASWGAALNLWIAQAAQDNVSSNVSSYPSSYTNGTRTVGGTSTTGAMVVSARRYVNAATEDPGTFTFSGSVASTANTIVVKPGGYVSVTTTGSIGYSYNYFFASGEINNQSGDTITYGTRYGAGAGYSGTSCQDLPNSQAYSTVPNGTNAAVSAQASSGVTPNTLYYFCLYATSGSQQWYSPTTSSITTTAPPVPTMDTMIKGEITSTTANITGTVNTDYGLSITAKGVCYSSTNTNPSLGGGGSLCTSNGTGGVEFTANLTGLSANTLYYYRSYATSSSGTGYANASSFTTEPTSPPANYPQIISTTGFYNRNNSTVHNVVMPTVIDSGDLLLALVGNDGSATITTPSGWTSLSSVANSTNLRASIFYKFADGSEDGTSINFQTSASESMAVQVYRIKDALAVEAGTPVVSSGLSADPPSLSPSWGAENTLWMPFLVLEQGVWPSAYPSNYTNFRQDADTYSSGPNWQGAFSMRRYINASSEDPSAFTTPNVNWIVNTIAIRPKPTVPSVTTNSASSITASTATLNGAANPNGLSSTGWFRYYTSNPGTCSDTGGTLAPNGGATALFSDSFESGNLNSMTGTAVSQTGSALEANTSSERTGTYGMQSVVNNSTDTSGEAAAYKDFTFPGTNKVVLEFDFNWNSFTRSGYNIAGSKAVAGIFSGTDRMAWLSVQGNRQLKLGYRSENGTDTISGNAYTFTQNTWYKVKLLVDKSGSDPVVTWWVDDLGGSGYSQQATATDSTSGSDGLARTPSRAYFGAKQILNWEQMGYTLFYDNVGIFDTPDTESSIVDLGSGTSSVPFTANITGLTPQTPYYYCAIAENSNGKGYGSPVLFTTLVGIPTVTTNAASSVAQTTATINATANPNGFASTGWFRYYTTNPGTCSDTGGTRVPTSSGTSLGSGSSGVPYNRPLTGLSPDTTYYVCAFANNTHGTGAGSPVSFTTLPGAPTTVNLGTPEVGSYFATLKASGNPNGFASYGFFRLYESNPGSCLDIDGVGTRYPSTEEDDASIGFGSSSQQFNIEIEEGLTPQTQYYYCAFVKNAHGTAASTVGSFTTPDGPIGPCDPPAGGNHTINGSCRYEGEVGGVDSGTGANNNAVLTISSGKWLTLNPGQQVAWGGISLQPGAAVNLSSGGALRKAPLWFADADSDSYISSTEQQIGAQPQGGVRRNTLSSTYNYLSKILALDEDSIDCNDNNEYIYRIINNLVKDADHDRYKTAAAPGPQCVGASTVINVGGVNVTYYNDGSGPN